MAGLKLRQAAEDFRCQGTHIREVIQPGAQHNNREWQIAGFMLVRKFFVHSQKYIKFVSVGDEPEQPAVFDAGPAGLRNDLGFVAGQLAAEARGQAFVQEDSHLCCGQHPFAGCFEKGDGLTAGNRWEILQEIVE